MAEPSTVFQCNHLRNLDDNLINFSFRLYMLKQTNKKTEEQNLNSTFFSERA